MNPKSLVLTIAFCISLTAEAHALWGVKHVSPQIEDLDDGMVKVTAIRALPEENAQLDRSNRLTISDGTRTILQTSVKPIKNGEGNLVYEFKVRKEFLPHAKLEVFEKEKRHRHILGGGTIYVYAVRHPSLNKSQESINPEPEK